MFVWIYMHLFFCDSGVDYLYDNECCGFFLWIIWFCVYVSLCFHIFVFICLCETFFVNVNVSVWVCVCVCVCVCMGVYYICFFIVFVCVCVFVCLCVFIYEFVFVYVYLVFAYSSVQMNVCDWMHLQLLLCKFVCLCLCEYMCMYVSIFFFYVSLYLSFCVWSIWFFIKFHIGVIVCPQFFLFSLRKIYQFCFSFVFFLCILFLGEKGSYWI